MIKHLILFLIKGYQVSISKVLPSSCRFYPSCSQYMIDAIHRFGVGKGFYLGIKRILKCHPFHPGGYNPVGDPHEPI